MNYFIVLKLCLNPISIIKKIFTSTMSSIFINITLVFFIV